MAWPPAEVIIVTPSPAAEVTIVAMLAAPDVASLKTEPAPDVATLNTELASDATELRKLLTCRFSGWFSGRALARVRMAAKSKTQARRALENIVGRRLERL